LSEAKLLKLFRVLTIGFEATGRFNVSDYQTEAV